MPISQRKKNVYPMYIGARTADLAERNFLAKIGLDPQCGVSYHPHVPFVVGEQGEPAMATVTDSENRRHPAHKMVLWGAE